MRSWWFAVLATGCGRIGFDPLGSTDASAPVVHDFTDFTTCPFVLNGVATCAGGALLLTSLTEVGAGSAFLPESFTLTPTTSVHTTFSFLLSGGDGIVFTLQSSADGSAALGLPGGALGYAGGDIGPEVGIAPSLGVELDVSQNAIPTEPDGNHIAIDVGGRVDIPLGVASSPIVLKSPTPNFLWVDYDAQVHELAIAIAPEPVRPASLLVRNVDLVLTVGTPCFIGFTGATGANVGSQQILSWSLALEP